MPRRKRMTANQMIRNGGLLNFRRAVRHASRFGAACSHAGRLLTLAEYEELTGLSRAQAYREQQAWRACVGGSLTVLEVVSDEALSKKGFTDEEREDVIARELASGG